MSIKHSEASKARWANVSAEDRSRKMSAIAETRQSQLTKTEKHENAMRMVRARRKKAKSKKKK